MDGSGTVLYSRSLCFTIYCTWGRINSSNCKIELLHKIAFLLERGPWVITRNICSRSTWSEQNMAIGTLHSRGFTLPHSSSTTMLNPFRALFPFSPFEKFNFILTWIAPRIAPCSTRMREICRFRFFLSFFFCWFFADFFHASALYLEKFFQRKKLVEL